MNAPRQQDTAYRSSGDKSGSPPPSWAPEAGTGCLFHTRGQMPGPAPADPEGHRQIQLLVILPAGLRTCPYYPGKAQIVSATRKSVSGCRNLPCCSGSMRIAFTTRKSTSVCWDLLHCPRRVQIIHPTRKSAQKRGWNHSWAPGAVWLRKKGWNLSSWLHKLWSYTSTDGFLNSVPVKYPKGQQVLLQLWWV